MPTQQQFSVLEALAGAHVFVTGFTGFLGKVFVEKLLRSVPDVAKVWVLIRPNACTAEERLEGVFQNSRIWEPLRELKGDAFDAWIRSKVVAVSGEMTADNLGTSNEWQAEFHEKCRVIVHCAATIDFDYRLDGSVDLNVRGPLRLLKMAKRCVDLRAMIDVSTAYVNCRRHGTRVMERIYPLGFDVQEWLQEVDSLSDEEIANVKGTRILRGFPNTYTVTKCVAEHLIREECDGVPLAIVRPSMVGGAREEPLVGWVDAVAAIGAGVFAGGLGILKILPGDPDRLADTIPVDHVINVILLAIGKQSALKRAGHEFRKDNLLILHAASTGEETPPTWGLQSHAIVTFFQANPPSKRISRTNFTWIKNPWLYDIMFRLYYVLPVTILSRTAPFGSKKYKANAELMAKVLRKVENFSRALSYFFENEWAFDTSNRREVASGLRPEEEAVFPTSLEHVDWDLYMRCFCRGMMIFVMGDDVPFSRVFRKPTQYEFVSPSITKALTETLTHTHPSGAQLLSKL